MDSQLPSPRKAGISSEFVYEPAASSKPPRFKVGRTWASALTGFVAGAVVAAIILVPWMFVLNKFCPVSLK